MMLLMHCLKTNHSFPTYFFVNPVAQIHRVFLLLCFLEPHDVANIAYYVCKFPGPGMAELFRQFVKDSDVFEITYSIHFSFRQGRGRVAATKKQWDRCYLFRITQLNII